jgi:hypothetical protein
MAVGPLVRGPDVEDGLPDVILIPVSFRCPRDRASRNDTLGAFGHDSCSRRGIFRSSRSGSCVMLSNCIACDPRAPTASCVCGLRRPRRWGRIYEEQASGVWNTKVLNSRRLKSNTGKLATTAPAVLPGILCHVSPGPFLFRLGSADHRGVFRRHHVLPHIHAYCWGDLIKIETGEVIEKVPRTDQE